MIKPSAKPIYLRVGFSGAKPSGVDRNGGDYGAGLISGFSVITRGEAKGHGLWIDREFIAQVANAGMAKGDAGLKSHFTHGNMSSDGLGTLIGRAKNFRSTGDQLFADLHLTDSAHKAPDGDLADYVMSLADETPNDFGTSIVFSEDLAAEENYVKQSGGRVAYDRDGAMIVKEFVSPDPENRKNLVHARLKDLHAVDAVDDPAANPNGLFSSESNRGSISLEADRFLKFALGLSDEPEPYFNIDPDRARKFMSEFLAANELSIVQSPGEPSVNELFEELEMLKSKLNSLREYVLRQAQQQEESK